MIVDVIDQDTVFVFGTTVRRCIDCGIAVAGGPTRCPACAEREPVGHDAIDAFSGRMKAARAGVGPKCPDCGRGLKAQAEGWKCCGVFYGDAEGWEACGGSDERRCDDCGDVFDDTLACSFGHNGGRPREGWKGVDSFDHWLKP